MAKHFVVSWLCMCVCVCECVPSEAAARLVPFFASAFFLAGFHRGAIDAATVLTLLVELA